MRRLVLLAPLAAVAAGCGGGGARSAALVDPAKFRTCMEQPNGDELIPPGGPRNALVVMFGEYHYGQGAVMLIGGYGRSVKDGNAARGKAEQWVDEHFGPGAPTLWDGPRSNVSYRVAGPVIVPNLPQGVTRAEVEKATIPVRRALRSTLKRCARETRRK